MNTKYTLYTIWQDNRLASGISIADLTVE